MPKTSKAGYYAVRRGRVPGIYLSWAECETQVRRFTGALYKKVNSEAEAIEYMSAKPSTTLPPVASTSRSTLPGPSNVHTRPVVAIPEDERDCDIVYCDGACKGNGQPGSIAGIGVWWGHGDHRNISERCPGDQTNNRAELIAIVRILETTPRLKRRLLIKTDSNYSIQCVTSWISTWMRNGFHAADGKPVKNRALIRYLAALLHVRRRTSQTVEFKHVRGHVGIQGNEAADQLANLGAEKPTVPEKDWERLEKQVLRTLKPVEPLNGVLDDNPQAYAAGLLSDDELGNLPDLRLDSDTSPSREPRRHHPGSGNHAVRSHTSISPAFPDISSRSSAPSRPSDGTAAAHSTSKLPSGKHFRPTVVVAQDLRPISSQKFSEEELQAFASCLLSDKELATLGKDGVFDSDF